MKSYLLSLFTVMLMGCCAPAPENTNHKAAKKESLEAVKQQPVKSEQSSVNEATKRGATREVSGDKMIKRRGLWYVKGETEPFTGRVFAYTTGLKPISKRGLKVVYTYVNGKELNQMFSSP